MWCRFARSYLDPYIEMPWDAQTGAGTGLYKWCAVVLKWSVIVDQRDVEDVTGKVPPAFLAKVRQSIADLAYQQKHD
jgi:hypothetical protein